MTRIDPMLGTEDDFRALCAAGPTAGDAGDSGRRVQPHRIRRACYFNADGYYPTLGAAQSQDSPWYSWYRFTPLAGFQYDSWWGIRTLPAVEESSPSYRGFHH